MKRIAYWFMGLNLLSSTLTCEAQENDIDIITSKESGSGAISDYKTNLLPPIWPNVNFLQNYEYKGEINSGKNDRTLLENYSHEIIIVELGSAFVPLWKNSGFLATGSISSFPGLMKIEKGSVGIGQNIGNFSVYLGAEANKYGFFNGLHTQYGINGTIQYSVSPKLTLTGYATYYFGNPPMMRNGLMVPPAMMGYWGVSSFGACVDYQINEKFGLIVGGEAEQQFGTNRYRFKPIVTPTIKLGRVRIGLPVGEIVNDLIRDKLERRKRH